MGLLTIIRKNKRKEKEIRVLMVGLDNAGKTTIVKRIQGQDISTVSPTLGFEIKTIQHQGSQVNIWDVGGQKSLRSYWRNYFEQTDALIWVVDSADTWRLHDCKEELHNLLKEERLAGASLLILANKQDQSTAKSAAQILEDLDLKVMTTRHWKVVACSAVTGDGLWPALDWLITDVQQRIYFLK